MGNLLSLNPKIHRLRAHAQEDGRVADSEREFFPSESELHYGGWLGVSHCDLTQMACAPVACRHLGATRRCNPSIRFLPGLPFIRNHPLSDQERDHFGESQGGCGSSCPRTTRGLYRAHRKTTISEGLPIRSLIQDQHQSRSSLWRCPMFS